MVECPAGKRAGFLYALNDLALGVADVGRWIDNRMDGVRNPNFAWLVRAKRRRVIAIQIRTLPCNGLGGTARDGPYNVPSLARQFRRQM